MLWPEEWDRVRQAPIGWLGTGGQDSDPRTSRVPTGQKGDPVRSPWESRGEKSQVESDRIRTWDIQGKPYSLSALCL